MDTVRDVVKVNGAKLRHHRALALMTQEDLVKASGVSRDTISRIELGQQNAHPRTLKKLAKALDVDPRELLNLN